MCCNTANANESFSMQCWCQLKKICCDRVRELIAGEIFIIRITKRSLNFCRHQDHDHVLMISNLLENIDRRIFSPIGKRFVLPTNHTTN